MKVVNYVQVIDWYTTWDKNHPGERMGQAFCNDFDIECSALFYTTDFYEAMSQIEEIMSKELGMEKYYEIP